MTMNTKFTHRRQRSWGPSRGGGYGRGRRSGGSQTGRRRGPTDEKIHPSKFINKVVVTEEVEQFVPEHAFSDFPIHPKLKEQIVLKGYETPTPIQDRAIPHILEGQDIVGIANTGTGKTAAFLIPLIHKVVTNRAERVLIIIPTRELAIQIEQELKSLSTGSGIYSVCVVGGANIAPQIAKLRMDNSFVIGTPGRLKDLVERGKIRLSDFTTLVLDEADRMLDMGFVNDMRAVVSAMPKARHTLFFSATISATIEKLIAEFLTSPVRISVKVRDTAQNVEQDVIRVAPGKTKFDHLHELLNQEGFSKVLVFGRTKHGVEKLSKALMQMGIRSESIHGNKTHGKRQRALGAFKSSQVQVLVATDVAARGLDIPDVSHVINFDLPATYDDYVHRIGRTGRGTKQGKALTFLE